MQFEKNAAEASSERGTETRAGSENKTMAYKEMNYTIYLGVTLALFWGEVICSLLVTDIGLIFEFVSAFSLSAIAFIFPGYFYLVAERKFATNLQILENKEKWMKCKAWFFIITGILAATLQLTATFLEIASGEGHHGH